MSLRAARPRLAADERHAIGTTLAKVAQHDAQVKTVLLQSLLDANVVDAADLHGAVSRRDWPEVHRCVHRIKGGAALARCPTLIAAAKSIESAAGQGNAAVVNALLPRFIAIVSEFNDTLSMLFPLKDVSETHGPPRDSTNLKDSDTSPACKPRQALAHCEPVPAAPPKSSSCRRQRQFRRETCRG